GDMYNEHHDYKVLEYVETNNLADDVFENDEESGEEGVEEDPHEFDFHTKVELILYLLLVVDFIIEEDDHEDNMIDPTHKVKKRHAILDSNPDSTCHLDVDVRDDGRTYSTGDLELEDGLELTIISDSHK
ncbi:hypothetical protein Tco_1058340, partial [Tanacetum coccineum]